MHPVPLLQGRVSIAWRLTTEVWTRTPVTQETLTACAEEAQAPQQEGACPEPCLEFFDVRRVENLVKHVPGVLVQLRPNSSMCNGRPAYR